VNVYNNQTSLQTISRSNVKVSIFWMKLQFLCLIYSIAKFPGQPIFCDGFHFNEAGILNYYCSFWVQLFRPVNSWHCEMWILSLMWSADVLHIFCSMLIFLFKYLL
jgi:hypothetical protein